LGKLGTGSHFPAPFLKYVASLLENGASPQFSLDSCLFVFIGGLALLFPMKLASKPADMGVAAPWQRRRFPADCCPVS